MPVQDITSPTFFGGGYVKRLSAELGFNSSPTSVDIEFVVDTLGQAGPVQAFNEDDLIPGSITGISLGSFSFSGVVQSWRENYSTAGRTYTARLVDPRIIFNDVTLCLDGRGPRHFTPENLSVGSGIYNYINVYEIFGNDLEAGYNDNGMEFNKIREGLEGSGFIYCYDKKFLINFDDGFVSPDYFRINSNETSLEQVLQEVSESLGVDYYATITDYSPDNEYNIITLTSIKRDTENNSQESILTYLNEKVAEGTMRDYSRGKELRTGPTDSIVLGANKNFIQTITESYPCYGRTGDGYLLSGAGSSLDVGVGYEDLDDENRHSGFVLLDNVTSDDVTILNNLPVITVDGNTQQLLGSTYPPILLQDSITAEIKGYRPTENVMRAALFSRESWESVLFLEQEDVARKFGIRGVFIKDADQILQLINNKNTRSVRFEEINEENIDRSFEEEALINLVYEKTREVADTYYGRQFIVRLPFTGFDLPNGSNPSQGLRFRFGWRVVDSAWYENSSQKLRLSGNRKFRDDEGKIKAHATLTDVRGNQVPGVVIKNPNGNIIGSSSILKYDLSILNEEDYIIDNTDLHISISVEQDSTNLGRAIITLNEPIILREIIGIDIDVDNKIPASFIQFLRFLGFTDDEIINQNLLDLYEFNEEYGLAPQRVTYFNLFQIPIENQFTNYGPYIRSADRHAGIKVIRDTSLAPWTYNSITTMNQAGQDMADISTANRTVAESASFTLAGLPEKNLGDEMGDNANITSLSINLGTELSTSYGMQQNIGPFTRLSKVLSQKIYKNSIIGNQTRKDLIKLEERMKDLKTGPDGIYNLTGRIEKKTKKLWGRRNFTSNDNYGSTRILDKGPPQNNIIAEYGTDNRTV